MPPIDAPTVLRLHGLTKRFGAVTANDAVNLTLRRGAHGPRALHIVVVE